MSAADVIVAGGGPAGAAAAIGLAAAGCRVVVVERSTGPEDKVCGEFLSGETMTLAARLGVDVAGLGARPIGRVGVPGGAAVRSVALPFAAAGLSRRRLDEALLARAAAAGAEILRGGAVRGFAVDADGATVTLDGGRVLAARRLVVATGKHDLRDHHRPQGPQGDLVGFKMHYAPADPSALDGRVDLLGLPGGYAGLQRIEDGLVNLCLLVGRDRLAAAGGFDGVVADLVRRTPALAGLLARPVLPRPLAIARLPYGFVRRRADGVRWVGDQAAVIPSFTGDGMAIALWTGTEAAASILAGETTDAFQARVAATLAGQVGRAAAVSRLMVRPWFQTLAATAAARLPGLARALARTTRLPVAV
ncbi:NAD(P)/FAD-dependent oxidoreductase [Oharaeibacter diazotrophicus]|uniref:NAD(P)/FAD-dependent oxidoreductase n=3 Tax=Oharaeibacter diazotrophicus TaxID=1920512 RepID=UPI0014151222|nr:FAD-dependent monooxygenase [Oharaeibacter diazotrophicus]GLS75582.1 hypothetical protein GCM10007904_09170 [Oharaeibacter diazotrophicus]